MKKFFLNSDVCAVFLNTSNVHSPCMHRYSLKDVGYLLDAALDIYVYIYIYIVFK